MLNRIVGCISGHLRTATSVVYCNRMGWCWGWSVVPNVGRCCCCGSGVSSGRTGSMLNPITWRQTMFGSRASRQCVAAVATRTQGNSKTYFKNLTLLQNSKWKQTTYILAYTISLSIIHIYPSQHTKLPIVLPHASAFTTVNNTEYAYLACISNVVIPQPRAYANKAHNNVKLLGSNTN